MITMYQKITPEFLASQNLSPTFQERFWSKIKKRDTCWIWTGVTTKNGGYGLIQRGSPNWGMILSHRASYILFNGSIPDGLCVCHTCDNPPCVNPNHLWLGTRSDNQQDCEKKARRHPNPKRGILNKNAKLSEDNVREILEAFKNPSRGLAYRLAERYSVTPTAIWYIKHGIAWAHLQGHD